MLYRLNHYILFCFFSYIIYGQENIIEGLYNDPSLETQTAFVNELLYVAGYVPEKIEVYQTLPNFAHVFRVKLDSINGGFIFVRWDKNKKEHFLANKLIDPGLYYNLNTAREIIRKQTQNATFSVKDGSIQASDQERIGGSDLEELRLEYDKKENEKQKIIRAEEDKARQKEQRKIERKASKKN